MREIEFRGKRTDNGEWVYGYYCPVCMGAFPCRSAIIPEPTGKWEPMGVDPETVGQYTGFTDKNGKKIYEGDILEVTSCMDEVYNAEVAFENMEWELYDVEGGDPVSLHNQAIHCEKMVEVIGNKWDKP